jgi:hypothetical protein
LPTVLLKRSNFRNGGNRKYVREKINIIEKNPRDILKKPFKFSKSNDENV